MVGMFSLWLPILISAVFVFVVSAILHMLLGHHKSDWARLPNESDLAEAFRKSGVGPGDYRIPYCTSMAEMKSADTLKKFEQGPVGYLTLLRPGPPAMGKSLVQWFLFTVGVGIVTAYVTGRTVGAMPDADYLDVFRVAGTVSFLTYAGSEPVRSIWMSVRWSSTIKNMIDGLIYALLTAGTFGWLWP